MSIAGASKDEAGFEEDKRRSFCDTRKLNPLLYNIIDVVRMHHYHGHDLNVEGMIGVG